VWRYAVRRFVQAVVLWIGVTALSFAIIHAAPGGPVQFFEDPRFSPEVRDEIERSFGLRDPIPVQYARWLSGVVRLDFGRSFADNRPVMERIVERWPNSLQLTVFGLVVGLLGIPLGVASAVRRGGLFDNVVRVAVVLLNAVPHWWLGLMALIVVANTAPILPLGGMTTVGRGDLLDRLWHMLLPGTLLAMGGWIVYARFMRSEMLEVLQQDYVRTARAKGVPEARVLRRHALRNALIPVATILGGSLPAFFGGTLLIETIFSWPGLGRLFYDAASGRDYPTLMAVTVIGSFLVLMGNLVADLLYGVVDPRVRYD
jgi:peptide/nickel transport system permease protein